MTTLKLALLGPFEATLDERPLSQFRTNKVQALLIYLVSEPGVHKREALMTLLWPGLPQTSARTNLRQIVYQLRKAVPELDANPEEGQVPFLLSERQDIQVNPQATVDLDVANFSRLIQESQTHDHPDLQTCSRCQERLEAAVALYGGPFLTDFYLADSSLFEQWAQVKRELLQRQMVDALDILATINMRPGHYAQAQSYARRQLEIDNLNEHATRQLMEALARHGQRSAAMAAYDTCRRLLRDELGMAPTRKTSQLYQQIMEDELGLELPQVPAVRGYELLDEIGSGAFGIVHRAYQQEIGREVAVKIIQPQLANKPDFIRIFDAEAQTIARLEHPHIVPLYDFWREPDAAYIVMRWLRGGSLVNSLAGGPWPLDKAVTLINQIASALHVTHSQGIIHRDIKPANILLDEEGNAYLSDFGIAKDLEQEERQTMIGELKGTPSYGSPEQLLHEELSPLTDQYSLGIVLYELLTGERPFSHKSLAEMIQQQINQPLPLVCEQLPDIPPAVDSVLQRATAKQAQSRYPTILAFAAAFTDAVYSTGPAPSYAQSALLDIDVANPYKGLRAFQEADADLFFGRESLVQRLIEQLSETRFLAVVGPSGSGKSSVVKAGLLPALRLGAVPGSQNWFVAEMTPGSFPLEELEAALLHIAVNPPPSLLEPLQKDERGLARTLKRVLPIDQKVEGPSQLLLVIDQFEELFTMVTDAGRRQHFLNNLLTAVNDPHSRLRVIITLRADFYDRPLQVPQLGELLRQHSEIVLPLQPTELQQAITEPAALAGVEVEPGLAATITADVFGQPGALPLMQYALTELFDHRVGRVMTRGTYQDIGGVLGALGRRAEEIYQDLDHEARELTRQLFLRLVTLGEDSDDTRRRVLLSELETLSIAAQPNAEPGAARRGSSSLLNEFGQYRLLTFDRDAASRAPTIEIAHESLLHEWPRLADWLQESRSDVRRQRLLAAAAAEWLAAGRNDDFLLRGSRLDQFSGWAETNTIALTQDEQDFLAASLHMRQARRAAEEARLQHELEIAQNLAETERKRAADQTEAAQALRRRAIFLVGALAGAAILALAALVAGRQALQNAGEAQNNLALAVSREAEAVANQNLAATQESLAQQNAALAATRETDALQSANIAATRQTEAETESWARATAESVAINERELAQQQENLAISRELSLAAQTNLEADPELSILLALQALDTSYTKEAEEALHQSIQASRVLQTLSNHDPIFEASIFNPDGSQIATASPGTIKLWDAASGELLRTLPFDGIEYMGATLKYDDSGQKLTMLTVGDSFESVFFNIWDTNSGRLLVQKELPVAVHNFNPTLNPDWTLIAAGYEDGTAELWDVETNELLLTLSGHNDEIGHLIFTPDGTRLVTISSNNQVIIWDIERSLAAGEGQVISSFTTLNDSTLNNVFVSNDNTRLALLYTRQDELELWDMASLDQPQFTLAGHESLITYVDFSSDDTVLATSSTDSTVKLWDLATAEELLTLSGHKGFVGRLDFSPDDSRLVTAGLDGTARIWNLDPQGVGEHFAFSTDLSAFDLELSPDEQKLALGSLTGPATIWDTATGEQLLFLQGPADTATYRTAFSPDGTRIATVGEDGIVRIWHVQTGDNLLAFSGHTEGTSGGLFRGTLDVSFSPDGSRLATAGADGLAKVWDAATGAEILTLAGHTAGLHSLAYSPDGKLIATSSDNPDTSVKVWDAQTGAERYSFGPNPGRAWGLAFSPDSLKLAAAGQSGYIKVWDMVSGQKVADMTGQSSTIRTVEFTGDGQKLISGSRESASFWDVASGTELLNIAPGHRASVALSNDGRLLYATDENHNAVQVYVVPLEDAIALGQSHVTRSLSEAECRQYLHLETCPET